MTTILPSFLKGDTKKEVEEWEEFEKNETKNLKTKKYIVKNPGLYRKTIDELHIHKASKSNISQIRQGKKAFVPEGNVSLTENTVVTAVGTEEELEKLGLFLGEEIKEKEYNSGGIISAELEVSGGDFSGKTLAELEIKKNIL